MRPSRNALLAVAVALFAAAPVSIAQTLPPPVNSGQLTVEVSHAGAEIARSVEYQPPSEFAFYSILGQKIGASVAPSARTTANTTIVPGEPHIDGETVIRFAHDPSYESSHPEVPTILAGWRPVWDARVTYPKMSVTTTWRNGQVTFVLTASSPDDAVIQQMKGPGMAPLFRSGAPGNMPVMISGVSSATRGIGTLQWWPPGVDYRFLPGTAHYFTVKQDDGRIVVYNILHFRTAGELFEFYPIGEAAVSGTPGRIGSLPREQTIYATMTPPLAAGDAVVQLQAELGQRAFDPDKFELLSDATADYVFTQDSASASKLRYKLGIQAGLARTITWAETFTPEGEAQPSDYAFYSEAVSAAATETQVRVIDPFESGNPHRFGGRRGVYRIVPFEASLAGDANGDNHIVPPVGPVTPYVVGSADGGALGSDFRFQPNLNDDIDAADEDPAATTGGPDYANERVDGVADLAGFTPVYLDIGALLKLLPPDNGFSYRLRHADSALNFVYTNLTQKTAFDFRLNPDSGFGPDLDYPARSAPTHWVTADGVDLFGGANGFRLLAIRNQGAVILVEARRATAQPLVLEVSRQGQIAAAITLPLNLISAQLLVDANRDGEIQSDGSDATSSDKPFRFWVNDDDDEGPADGNDIPGRPAGSADYNNAVVDSVRDLVDLFPVFLDIKQLLGVLPHTTAGITYKLKQADGALNFVYTNKTRAQVSDYQKQILTTGFGPAFTQAADVATTQQITAAGVTLNTAFLDRVKNNDGGVILIEGRVATTAPLRLGVEKDGTEIAEVAVSIRISPVEEMFRHVNLTGVPKNYDGTAPSLPEAPEASRTGTPVNWPDAQTNGKYFVFLHGYNVDAQKARGWQAEVFKRLHVLGSKARFVGVTWHGATGLDYHRAVFHAFQTGDSLAGALSFTGNADVTIAGHSLGNMVVSHAIQSGGLSPARYYMINAATPIEAYDLGDVGPNESANMTELAWRTYDTRLYMANWHTLFAGTSDNRRSLTWKDLFVSVTQAQGLAHNFYSEEEDVVTDADSNTSASIMATLLNQGFDVSTGAWKAQELVKGVDWTTSLASVFMIRGQAGWGFNLNDWYTMTTPSGPPGQGGVRVKNRLEPGDTTSIPNEELKAKPFFDHFLESALVSATVATASDIAGEAKVRYDLFARGIPAMSNAVAANFMTSLGSRNYPMHTTGKAASNGAFPTPGSKWRHSDFKAVALPYVYPMYEEMISRGALK